MLGTHFPEVFRIEIDATINRMVSRFPHFFVTDLLVAYVQRCRGNDAEAEAALHRAREGAPPSDELAYLLPTEQEWRGIADDQRLVEVVPGEIWRLEAFHPAPLTVPIEVGTLVRTAGELIFINPVARRSHRGCAKRSKRPTTANHGRIFPA